MNITYRITTYPPFNDEFHWVILVDHKPVEYGREASFKDALDYMTDISKKYSSGKPFAPHSEDSRWKDIRVKEIESSQFSEEYTRTPINGKITPPNWTPINKSYITRPGS